MHMTYRQMFQTGGLWQVEKDKEESGLMKTYKIDKDFVRPTGLPQTSCFLGLPTTAETICVTNTPLWTIALPAISTRYTAQGKEGRRRKSIWIFWQDCASGECVSKTKVSTGLDGQPSVKQENWKKKSGFRYNLVEVWARWWGASEMSVPPLLVDEAEPLELNA